MAVPKEIHDLINLGEHTSCRHFKVDLGSGFKYSEPDKGDVIDSKYASANYIIFFLDGVYSLSCNEFPAREFHKNEMILIPKDATTHGIAITDCKILIYKFETILSGCDKFALQSYEEYCENVRYTFKPTEIINPLKMFIDQMVYYLSNGLNCVCLHDMKQKELFLLMRGFYSPDELADFFHPIIGKSLDFRQFVMKNYEKVHSVEELVNLSKYGRSSFFAKFKQEFGMSVKEWMLAQKAKQVLLRLSDPEITVKSVMQEFDFDTYEQFNRFCKNHYHNTPSALLKVFKQKHQ
jgi:AraC-like DNA-binding protein